MGRIFILIVLGCLFQVQAKDYDVETIIIESKDCDCKCPSPEQCKPCLPAPQVERSIIENGGLLHQGQCLASKNKQFNACTQGDGNFVIKNAAGNVVWQTGTANNNVPGPYRLGVQSVDNNVCLYGKDQGPGRGAVWCAFTHGPGTGLAHLELRNDGNLVLQGIMPIWSTKTGFITIPHGGMLISPACLTSLNGLYKACMQNDGNLVVKQGATVLYQTNSAKNNQHAPYRLEMGVLEDNNVCILGKEGGPGNGVWCAYCHDRGVGKAALTMQDDGNLVAYNEKPIWSTKFGLM